MQEFFPSVLRGRIIKNIHRVHKKCVLFLYNILFLFSMKPQKALNLFIGFLKPPCSQHKFKFFHLHMGPNDAQWLGRCYVIPVQYLTFLLNATMRSQIKNKKKLSLLYFTFCAEPLGTTTLQNGRNLFIAFFLVQIYLHRCLLLVDDDGRREVLSCLNQKG